MVNIWFIYISEFYVFINFKQIEGTFTQGLKMKPMGEKCYDITNEYAGLKSW